MARAAYKTGGDDLEDGLALEPDLLASDSEAESSAAGSLRAASLQASEDGEYVYEDEDLGEGQEARRVSAVAGVKRKADSPELEEEGRKAEQRRKRRQKDKERKAKKREQRDTEAAELDAARLSPAQLDELLLASIRETFPAATPMEIGDLRIPVDQLLEAFEGKETSLGEFATLQARVSSSLKGKQSEKLQPSTPKVIILSLSGLRCADVVRGVKDVKMQGGVAKLFAKHFKLKDQIAYLSTAKVSVAVGTPARVGKLLEEGALKVTKETIVLLDVGYRDSKTRTLLTLPEVRMELWKGIFTGKTRDILLGSGARIGAF